MMFHSNFRVGQRFSRLEREIAKLTAENERLKADVEILTAAGVTTNDWLRREKKRLEVELAGTEAELESVEKNRKKWVAQFVPAEMYHASDHDEHGEALERWREKWNEMSDKWADLDLPLLNALADHSLPDFESISQKLEQAEVKIEEVRRQLKDEYCATCQEIHSPESQCPPFEVRTTGSAWFVQRIDYLEKKLICIRAIAGEEKSK